MANTNMPGIKNSWSLMAFAHRMGKLISGTCVNSDTGETFPALRFVNPDTKEHVCFMAYSSKMPEENRNAEYIKAHKNSLQVVELQSGSFILCEQGEGSWEDIDLD